jgi:predicted O-methyltransferase YrrM
MMTNPVLQEILASKTVVDESGATHELHSETSEEEGAFIAGIIQQHRFSRALEIGCAFGISALYICDALSQQSSPRHVMIDPNQKTEWYDVGRTNLERAGFRFVELIEEPSELALPALLRTGKTFQFAFIDGWHTFDHVLLDFFYVNRLLEEGGEVVFDDVWMPSIRKVVRYIANYPCYKVAGGVSRYWSPFTVKKRKKYLKYARPLLDLLPKAYVREIFDNAFLEPDHASGLNYEMVAFQKTGPDSRDWDWFQPF